MKSFKFKKLLAVILSVILIISILPISALTVFAEEEGMFNYYVSDEEATVTGLTDESYSGELNIP